MPKPLFVKFLGGFNAYSFVRSWRMFSIQYVALLKRLDVYQFQFNKNRLLFQPLFILLLLNQLEPRFETLAPNQYEPYACAQSFFILFKHRCFSISA